MIFAKRAFFRLFFLSLLIPGLAFAKPSSNGLYKKAISSSTARQSMSDSNLWVAIHWALSNNKETGAIRLLDTLESRKKRQISNDEIQLLRGRALYQKNQFKAAATAYRKVSKSSDLWLNAVEERAWAHVRSGDYNQAIADTKTIMSPLFSEVVTPESYFVSSYVAHRVCNFEDVFKITDTMKKRSRLRIEHLEKLARMEVTRGLHEFMFSLAKNGLEDSLTKYTLSLFPKHFYRNKKFLKAIKRFSGPQSLQAVSLRTALAEMAKVELAHYREVIGKIHLIEADTIQRMYLDKDLAGKRQWLPSKNAKGEYDLEFKHDENDVWIDEIDNLSVKAKNCPKLAKNEVPR